MSTPRVKKKTDVIDGMKRYCPLCKKIRQIVIVWWMHQWYRCEYCLIKLPLSKKMEKYFK